MNTLIIYSHPSKKSFTHKILEQVKKGLQDAGHDIDMSDLYAMNFNAVLSEDEYNRDVFSNSEVTIPLDVRLEQAKIEHADCIIFIYPVWWSDCPANLKGWFDRVFTAGYAYGYDANGQPSRRMKKLEYGLVICTAGHPNEFLDSTGISESMKKIMIDDRLGDRFKKKEMIILGGTLELDKLKDRHKETAYQLGKEIKNQCG